MFKKFFSLRLPALFLSVIILLSIMPMANAEINNKDITVTYGDLNGDRQVTAEDALITLQAVVGKINIDNEKITIADVDGNGKLKVSDALLILQYSVNKIDKFPVENNTVFTAYVTSEEYGAKGNGIANDREAIQKAIDAAYSAGGGIVYLDAGKIFCTGNIILRSNVTLYFEENAKIKQSNNPDDFIIPTETGYEACKPMYSHDFTEANWGHASFYNYPLIYAGEGTENVTVTGKGIIEMSRGSNCDTTLHMCPIGMYKTNNFKLSEFTIQQYNTYAINSYNCIQGLIENVTVKDPTDGNGDGFSMCNSQDIRITGCNLTTSDDGIYIWSDYNDPRTGTWCSTTDPIPSKNYEIDNNYCDLIQSSLACKAFAFISWGANAPDQRQNEISNIYVHDNYFRTIGAWTGYWIGKTFDFNGSCSAMKDIRFENNRIDEIQNNFYSLIMSNVIGFDSMSSLQNGDFEKTADSYWSSDGLTGVLKDAYEGNYSAYADFSEDSCIYQGLRLESNATYKWTAMVKTTTQGSRWFVKNGETGETVFSKEITAGDWHEEVFEFTVDKSGNYQIGLERGNAQNGIIQLDNVVFTVLLNDIAGEPEGYILMSDQKPTSFSNGGGYRNELGVMFTPKVDGTITKVRIYTSVAENGIHYVSVWDYNTRKLVSNEIYEWYIVPGYEGWREFTLPESVKVTANTQYVLSVSAGPDCLFAVNTTITKPLENKYLTTPDTSGISSADANNDFHKMPTNIISGWSFFRDFEFVPDKEIEDPEVNEKEEHVFTDQIPTEVSDGGGFRNELGMIFSSKVNGTITKVRVYTCASESGIHFVSIWDKETGSLVTKQIYEWDITAGVEGWREYTLPESIEITANKQYVVSVSAGPDCLFVKNTALGDAVANGNLIIPENAGVFSADAINDFHKIPTGSIPGWNFFRDIVFVADEN